MLISWVGFQSCSDCDLLQVPLDQWKWHRQLKYSTVFTTILQVGRRFLKPSLNGD